MKVCRKCNLAWYYPVKKCIFCGSGTEDSEPSSCIVKGFTKVHVPSGEHKETPYFNLLLEDAEGNLHIRKSLREYGLGDTFTEGRGKEPSGNKRIVGVVGTGSMGLGIAQVALQAGFNVVLKSRSEKSLKKARSVMEAGSPAGTGKPPSVDITYTSRFEDLACCDIVIESIVEDIVEKKALLKTLEGVCRKDAILATNTSSLSIDEMSSVLSNPGRFVGLHYFKPATKMRLVEVVKGVKTTKKTVDYVANLAREMNKVPVVTKDSPCFIVNRILMPYLNEATYAFEEDVASAEDIDTAAKLGLNHPLGPLQLLDLIGLDVFLAIMDNLYERTKNSRYLACDLVRSMVSEGRLGRKSGEGFYKY